MQPVYGQDQMDTDQAVAARFDYFENPEFEDELSHEPGAVAIFELFSENSIIAIIAKTFLN